MFLLLVFRRQWTKHRRDRTVFSPFMFRHVRLGLPRSDVRSCIWLIWPGSIRDVIFAHFVYCSVISASVFQRSERVSKTGVDGVLLSEAKYINLSLHFLEQVRTKQSTSVLFSFSICARFCVFVLGYCITCGEESHSHSIQEFHDDVSAAG